MKTKNNELELRDSTESASTELTPESAAFEASLAAARPLADSTVLEKTKALGLMEICRQAAPQANLIETILDAGERRITLSLRQYIRAERFRAGLVGVVLGLIFGAILNVFGMAFLFMLLKIL